MFTALDSTLAYGRREEVAREVGSGRLDTGSRTAPGGRRRRWSLRLLRAPSGVEAAGADSA